MSGDMLLYNVWLSMALRSCSQRLWSSIEIYKDAKGIYEAVANSNVKNFEEREIKRLKSTSLSQAKSVIEHCKEQNYEIITYYDEIYPEALRQIYNPPLVLYCCGRTEILKANRMISVVGTRKPSNYSVDVAQKFCAGLVRNKFVIVSGFALGIDSVAHGSALKNGGYSIAVIGCGLDYPYPKENFNSRDNFIKRGLIISEFIPSAMPEQWCFPHRNRILSGLSSATLVIEAGQSSGSLVTANLAADQGRDVFCIPPHDIFDKAYSGNIGLLKNGAIPAFSYSDILEEYSIEDVSIIPLKKNDAPKNAPAKAAVTKTNSRMNAPKQPSAAETLDKQLPELDEKSRTVFSFLQKRDMLVDEIAFETGIDMSELFLILTELEIAGLVETKAGNFYGAV